LSARGEVIGIATSLLRGGQALNFAVPIEYANILLAKSRQSKNFGGSTPSVDLRQSVDKDSREVNFSFYY
jgi:S1-C subfamily serine protease